MDTQRIERDGRIETMALSLAEWFEGYYEWHYYRNMEGKDRIALWDMGGGNRFISEEESYGIVREASRILTLYYDVGTGRRIIPWHHGAGDFIANLGSGTVDVRLVTVRGYEPFSSPGNGEFDHHFRDLLLFFLEVATKMRMDKREGVGYTTWADKAFVRAAAEGFFEAMRFREDHGKNGPIRIDEFITVARALPRNEIQKLIQSQLGEYQARDTSDYEVIQAHMEEHVQDIFNVLQHLSS
jgi:hypothetical protein